VIVAINNIG